MLAPDAKELGTLTEPREFNLMFETHIGAMQSDDSKAFLRPETAQGMFVNFRNVVDSSRVKVPSASRSRAKFPQRNYTAQLHLPHARVRADGDGVFLPPKRVT